MKTHITGFRQGKAWPLKGELAEVGDREGARLIQAGYAEQVEEVNDEATTEDTGGRPADPPGPDGTPSDRPDGEPGDEPGEAAEGEEDPWPKHVGGPVFELSDGSRVKGKTAAEQAQADLDGD